MKHFFFLSLFTTLLTTVNVAAQDIQKQRNEAVVEDKKNLKQNENWIYDDFETAHQQAARSKKPLMVVFR